MFVHLGWLHAGGRKEACGIIATVTYLMVSLYTNYMDTYVISQ